MIYNILILILSFPNSLYKLTEKKSRTRISMTILSFTDFHCSFNFFSLFIMVSSFIYLAMVGQIEKHKKRQTERKNWWRVKKAEGRGNKEHKKNIWLPTNRTFSFIHLPEIVCILLSISYYFTEFAFVYIRVVCVCMSEGESERKSFYLKCCTRAFIMRVLAGSKE